MNAQRKTSKTGDWTPDLHKRVARAVKHARERQGISAQQLADTTANLGYPITRNTLTNYENGRKQSLDVAELIVLAMALEVPPIMLLFGGHPDHDVEVTPGQAMPAQYALAWFTGDDALANGAVAQLDSYEGRLIKLIRQRAEKQNMAIAAQRGAMRSAEIGDDEMFGPAMDRAIQLAGEIDVITGAIIKLRATEGEIEE